MNIGLEARSGVTDVDRRGRRRRESLSLDCLSVRGLDLSWLSKVGPGEKVDGLMRGGAFPQFEPAKMQKFTPEE